MCQSLIRLLEEIWDDQWSHFVLYLSCKTLPDRQKYIHTYICGNCNQKLYSNRSFYGYFVVVMRSHELISIHILLFLPFDFSYFFVFVFIRFAFSLYAKQSGKPIRLQIILQVWHAQTIYFNFFSFYLGILCTWVILSANKIIFVWNLFASSYTYLSKHIQWKKKERAKQHDEQKIITNERNWIKQKINKR